MQKKPNHNTIFGGAIVELCCCFFLPYFLTARNIKSVLCANSLIWFHYPVAARRVSNLASFFQSPSEAGGLGQDVSSTLEVPRRVMPPNRVLIRPMPSTQHQEMKTPCR